MKQKGFTLIELLVVISIIGLLASVVLVSLNGARLKARDVKRLADIHQLQTALDLYYDQNNSVYPNPDLNDASHADPAGYSCGGWDVSSYNPFLTALKTAGLMSQVPVDPINTNKVAGGYDCGGYAYRYARYPVAYCADICKGGSFYVLGINAFESGPNYQSPGWKCTLTPANGGSVRDWGSEFAYVIGKCE